MQPDATPLVSVITPVYNAEPYIARCIASVLAQTHTRWEQIIVDDGSTDGTADVIRRYSDPRIKYIQLPHRGLDALAESYNHALAASSGTLVAILEGDDFWPDNKLALQTPVFDDPNVVLSWGAALTVDSTNQILRWWRQPEETPQPGRMQLATLFRLLTRKNALTPAATVMVRRSALDHVGGFRQTGEPLYVDLPTWLEISARLDGMAHYQAECLAYYRVHPLQTSGQRDYQMRFQHFEVVSAVLAQLGPAERARLRWTPADEVAALASASLTRGVASLNIRQRREALSHFTHTLSRTRVGRERLGALLGILSAATGVNVIGAAERVETRLRSRRPQPIRA
jgi:hypothetical protein